MAFYIFELKNVVLRRIDVPPNYIKLMNKTKTGLLILLLLSFQTIWSQTTITVKPKGIYAEIDLTAQNAMIELLIRPETRHVAIDTVFNNINKYNPPVLYMFAQALFAEGEKQNAIDWYLFAQLNTMYDIKRCTDNSVNDAFSILESLNRPVFEEYIKKHKDEYITSLEKVINLFSKTTQNYDYRWINLRGMNCMIASMEDANKKKEDKIELTKPKDSWPTIKETVISDFRQRNKQ